MKQSTVEIISAITVLLTSSENKEHQLAGNLIEECLKVRNSTLPADEEYESRLPQLLKLVHEADFETIANAAEFVSTMSEMFELLGNALSVTAILRVLKHE